MEKKGGGRKTEEEDCLRDTLHNTTGVQAHQLLESGVHAAFCSPESKHVAKTAWKKRLLFLICTKMSPFAKPCAHRASSIWGSAPFQNVPSCAVWVGCGPCCFL